MIVPDLILITGTHSKLEMGTAHFGLAQASRVCFGTAIATDQDGFEQRDRAYERAGTSSAFACRYSLERNTSTSMHVHPNQVNQYAQLDSMYAAQKAAGKRAAEQTRRKLLESASALAGEADSEAAVVKLRERDSSQQESKQNNQQTPRDLKYQEKRANSEAAKGLVSDWA
jgi:hypothetical protein